MRGKAVRSGCILVGLLLLGVILYVSCQTAVYFDINNGVTRSQSSILGFVYKKQVLDGAYSKLLTFVGVSRKDPCWVLVADNSPKGVPLIGGKTYRDYEWGRIASDAESAAALMSAGSTNTAQLRQDTDRLQGWVQTTNSEALKEYLLHLMATTGKNGGQ
jgi:hypothetical protein